MAYPFNGKTIIIDIGHGKDTLKRTGGKGVYKDGIGYHEHDFNSRLAIALEELLQYNGFKTIMYQKPFSNEIGLTQRTNYYNSIKADLVWSIHANAGNKAADGRCAFYWHTNNKTKKLAELFAEEIRNAGYTTHGNGTHASMLGSWTNLHITRVPKANAVLTENGFMTNDLPGINDDFELIFGSKKDEYVYDISRVHAKAICRHFGITFHDFKNEPKISPAPDTKKSPAQVKNQDFYRVRKSWNNPDSQKGAFLQLDGAKEVANKYGYNVYDWNGKKVYSGTKKSETPKPSKPVISKPKANLKVDGLWGSATTKALQVYFNTPTDGVISGQPKNRSTQNIPSAKYGTSGSTLIKTMQRFYGCSIVDGKISGTSSLIKAMQRKYNLKIVDGYVSMPSSLVKEIQRRLNNGTL